MITSRFILKVSQTGYIPIKKCLHNTLERSNSVQVIQPIELLWKPPEVLTIRNQPLQFLNTVCTKECDIYAFGIICFEIYTKATPFDVNINSMDAILGKKCKIKI